MVLPREPEIARGFEMAIKTVLALMLPIGLGLALFAEPLIEALYGGRLRRRGDAAPDPRRDGGAVGRQYHHRDRARQPRRGPDVYTVPALVALVPNLDPGARPHPPARGGRRRDRRPGLPQRSSWRWPCRARRGLFGAGGFVRVLAAPLAAGAAMALCAAALSGLPWVPAAIGSVAVYAAAFLAIERVFVPGDFAFYVSALPGSRSRAGRTTA